MSEWHGGKGSRNRVSNKSKFDENFDRIFGNKNNEDKHDDSHSVRTGSLVSDDSRRADKPNGA